MLPKASQSSSKYSPRASNQTPQDPKMWPKWGSIVWFYTSAIFLKIAPKTTQNAPKSSPKGLKMAILTPTWRLLAPSWLQVGAILPHLGEILVDPSPAKIDQNQPRQLLRDFLSQGRPQELPDPLQTSIFQVFRSIFQRFSSIFQNNFYRFRFGKIKAFLTHLFFNFLWERSSRKVPKGGGGGTRAQGVFDIYIYIYIYI